MSPIQGFTRQRKWQFGKQSVFGTAVVASRRLAWRGTLDIEPNWTDQEDVDVGSIDPLLPPFRTQLDVAASGLGGPLTYQDIPLIMASGVRGGVSPTGSGTAKTWAHESLSLTATELDYHSAEWSDDVTADGFRARDGVEESIEFSFEEGLGPWMVSADWRFGAVAPHVTPTAGLAVGSNLPLVFGADTSLWIDDTSGGIASTQISDALHSASVRIENTIDQKRFANGSNSRFAIVGYGLSARKITASFVFAKTDAIVAALNSETVDWLNADPVNRYVRLLSQSQTAASDGVPYSWDQRFSGTWRTRSDGDLGGNSTVTLELTGRYDAGLGHAYRSVVVNTLAALP